MSQYSYLDENQKNDKMDDQVDENEGANISLCFAHEKTSEINLMILPKILHSKKEVAEWKEMRSPDYWIKRAAEQKRLEEEANSATIDNLNNRFITSSNGNSVELVDLESVSGTVVECSGWSISPDVEMSQEDSAVWEKKLEDIQKAFTLEKQADQNRIKELEETVQRLQQKQNSAEESSGQLENVPGTSQTCDLGSAVHLTDKSEREADQRRIKELEEMLENLPKSGEAAKNLGGLDYALDDETSPSPVLNFSDTGNGKSGSQQGKIRKSRSRAIPKQFVWVGGNRKCTLCGKMFDMSKNLEGHRHKSRVCTKCGKHVRLPIFTSHLQMCQG